MKNIGINKAYLLVVGVYLMISCGSREYKTIPLESLDQKLKSKGDLIVKDILESINHEKGVRYLLDKEYATPMLHGRIMRNLELYNQAYFMVPISIGVVSESNLFQVIDKKAVKSMRYKLETDAESLKLIELKIDVNQNYKLADFQIYITSKDGLLKRQGILPDSVK